MIEQRQRTGSSITTGFTTPQNVSTNLPMISPQPPRYNQLVQPGGQNTGTNNANTTSPAVRNVISSQGQRVPSGISPAMGPPANPLHPQMQQQQQQGQGSSQGQTQGLGLAHMQLPSHGNSQGGQQGSINAQLATFPDEGLLSSASTVGVAALSSDVGYLSF